jgi:hypothetical protein
MAIVTLATQEQMAELERLGATYHQLEAAKTNPVVARKLIQAIQNKQANQASKEGEKADDK